MIHIQNWTANACFCWFCCSILSLGNLTYRWNHLESLQAIHMVMTPSYLSLSHWNPVKLFQLLNWYLVFIIAQKRVNTLKLNSDKRDALGYLIGSDISVQDKGWNCYMGIFHKQLIWCQWNWVYLLAGFLFLLMVAFPNSTPTHLIGFLFPFRIYFGIYNI